MIIYDVMSWEYFNIISFSIFGNFCGEMKRDSCNEALDF